MIHRPGGTCRQAAITGFDPAHPIELGEHAAQGLQEIGSHRLYRDKLAEGILPCLDREESDLVVMTCAVLGHLGSSAVVPELVRQLEADSARVRESAEEALKKITGMDLGPDPDLWRDLLR